MRPSSAPGGNLSPVTETRAPGLHSPKVGTVLNADSPTVGIALNAEDTCNAALATNLDSDDDAMGDAGTADSRRRRTEESCHDNGIPGSTCDGITMQCATANQDFCQEPGSITMDAMPETKANGLQVGSQPPQSNSGVIVAPQLQILQLALSSLDERGHSCALGGRLLYAIVDAVAGASVAVQSDPNIEAMVAQAYFGLYGLRTRIPQHCNDSVGRFKTVLSVSQRPVTVDKHRRAKQLLTYISQHCGDGLNDREVKLIKVEVLPMLSAHACGVVQDNNWSTLELTKTALGRYLAAQDSTAPTEALVDEDQASKVTMFTLLSNKEWEDSQRDRRKRTSELLQSAEAYTFLAISYAPTCADLWWRMAEINFEQMFGSLEESEGLGVMQLKRLVPATFRAFAQAVRHTPTIWDNAEAVLKVATFAYLFSTRRTLVYKEALDMGDADDRVRARGIMHKVVHGGTIGRIVPSTD